MVGMYSRFRLIFFATAPPETDPLSLHDALPILARRCHLAGEGARGKVGTACGHFASAARSIRLPRGRRGMISRSEEHTSELQSQFHLVCRLLLEKKKISLELKLNGDDYSILNWK